MKQESCREVPVGTGIAVVVIMLYKVVLYSCVQSRCPFLWKQLSSAFLSSWIYFRELEVGFTVYLQSILIQWN